MFAAQLTPNIAAEGSPLRIALQNRRFAFGIEALCLQQTGYQRNSTSHCYRRYILRRSLNSAPAYALLQGDTRTG